MIAANGENYNVVFNFVVIPAVVGILFLSAFEAGAVTVMSLLMGLAFLFLKPGLLNVLEPVIFIALVSASCFALRYFLKKLLRIKGKALSVFKEEYRSFLKLDNEFKAKKLHLEKAVHDISSLYQAPKQMIAANSLEELIACMKKSILGYFNFSKCKLIIFSFKEKSPRVEAVYNLPEANSPEAVLSGYEQALCEIMKPGSKPLIIDALTGSPVPAALNLPEPIRSFMAIPLTAGDRINGIFAIEEPLHDDISRFIILGNQFSIVLERIRLYELVQELAITDGLTGVFVRRYFIERLGEEINRARHFGAKLSFMMIDIDHFKKCNDRYGHLVGDAVLREISAVMKKNLREIDIMGRYGGEEFVVILPETEKSLALIAAQRLRKAVETCRVRAYDEDIGATISIGVASFPDDADDMSQLIDKADRALYKAKESGRNRVIAYGQNEKIPGTKQGQS